MSKKGRQFVRLARGLAFVILVAMGFAAGFIVRGHLGPSTETVADQIDGETIWTCSMHPSVRRNAPGQCPICGMDLIPLSQTAAARTELQISEEAIKLLRIQTQPVTRRFATTEVRMVGKVDYDETRIKTITAYVPGRIDRLFVDYTGITVRPGDHMVELYSPDLITAQAEFLQAVEAVGRLTPNSSPTLAQSVRATLAAAADKLRLLGLTDEQVEQIQKSGRVVDHLTIYAPRGGVVIEKNAHEGMYVQTGTRIYTIADLSRLWVKLDAYESDMQWLRYGQQVEFTTEAYPGEVFTGTISFIDPVLNDRTRTAKVRVIVDNPDGRLKPNLFVRATVRASVAAAGRVIDPRLADKWICPMHPEVVKDQAGACDVCEMALVTATELGYAPAAVAGPPPLVIPASVPLITGTRAVVYVSDPNAVAPTFRLHEVRLGPRAGDDYIVLDGLRAGQHVVTNGAFKIDSEMQIRGKISMMNPEPDSPPHDAHGHAMADEETPEGTGTQTHCPVMGNPIDKKVFTEYRGKKVYFCCPACIEQFLAEPEKYLDKLPQFKASLNGSPDPIQEDHPDHETDT